MKVKGRHIKGGDAGAAWHGHNLPVDSSRKGRLLTDSD
jgi:hypothetical protein